MPWSNRFHEKVSNHQLYLCVKDTFRKMVVFFYLKKEEIVFRICSILCHLHVFLRTQKSFLSFLRVDTFLNTLFGPQKSWVSFLSVSSFFLTSEKIQSLLKRTFSINKGRKIWKKFLLFYLVGFLFHLSSSFSRRAQRHNLGLIFAHTCVQTERVDVSIALLVLTLCWLQKGVKTFSSFIFIFLFRVCTFIFQMKVNCVTPIHCVHPIHCSTKSGWANLCLSTLIARSLSTSNRLPLLVLVLGH